MPFADAAARAKDSIFERGGSDALWLVGGVGDGIPCKVIFSQAQAVERFGDDRAALPTGQFKVRRSQVESPAEGDKIQLLDEAGTVVDEFEVVGTPLLDKYRLEWLVEAPPA